VVVGLGANLGDRLKNLQKAVDDLAAARQVRVVSVSPVYATEPVGPPQPRFLNAALRLETTLSLEELHALTRSIEDDAGRVRAERWGPRTLDIDILWAEERSEVPQLTIPHPRLEERPFALAPLLDVLPEAPRALSERLSALGGPPKRARETLSSPK
jgi:2-amino-4-hydroxy-6-hydroxymethyldihydropteridine diphosphokinase